jgi:polygalacturonase
MCGMKRMVVRNCAFSGTDIGLRFKSGVGRGGKTEDVYISNIVMNDIKDAAISIVCDYVDRPAGSDGKKMSKESLEYVPEFCDIHISDVTCVGAKVGIEAKGIKDQNCIYDIDIENSTIVYTKQATDIDFETAKVSLSGVKLVKLDAEAWPVK